jgi:anti-sigma B factor antagonist
MQDEITTIAFSGRIDASSSAGMEADLIRVMDEGHRNIIVDLSGVEYMSSAGLRVLLATLKRIKAMKGELRLSGLQPFVREVFDMTGFSKIFTIRETVSDAEKSIRA